MVSIIIGVIALLFAIYSMIPPIAPFFVLNWGDEVLTFLKGGVPILAFLIGLIAVFIGMADLKDKAEAKKEAKEEQTSGDKPQA